MFLVKNPKNNYYSIKINPNNKKRMKPDICLQCNAPLIGRSDKKFCSDACRYAYKNKMNKKSNATLIKVNKILRANRSILKSLNPVGKTTVQKDVLINKGYNFHYFTAFYKTKKGDVYFFCYEFGILKLAKNKVLLVNWQDYMRPGDTFDVMDDLLAPEER